LLAAENDRVIHSTFGDWEILTRYPTDLISDTRMMPALIALLQRPEPS
jgi:hypothetical protein